MLIFVELNSSDPLYDVKKREFFSGVPICCNVAPNIDEMGDLLAWARYVLYDGDQEYFDIRANKAYQHMINEQEVPPGGEVNYDYVDSIFKDPIDLYNEMSVWTFLWHQSSEGLLDFPSYLLEDHFKLKENKDFSLNKNDDLTFNQRNSLVLISKDKMILEKI